MKKNGKIEFSLLGLFLFFLTIAGTSSCAIMVFQAVNKQTNGNLTAIVFGVLGSILFGTIICVVIDIIRRKIMVDKPTKVILNATNEIAKGNFDIHLDIKHTHKKFDEYDKIMENINKMAEELNKNEVLKSDFVSNVSHEIKTPLAVIKNYATLLKLESLSASDKEKYLNELVLATNRLNDLISNILKLNKLENQKLDFRLEKFNLGEAIRQIVLGFENLFEKKNLTLDCNIKDVDIVSSKELLEIVWNNLISNAIKFTNKGGKVGIKVTEENEYAIVKISDTGIGIDNSTGMHIFDKFYQGDTSHSGEGNGLGLALVKKVITILGGEISVESKVNQGSTFKVKLRKK